MSRPQIIDDSIKGNALKKLQKEKIQTILDSMKDSSLSEKVVAVREYLASKNLPFKGVAEDVFMDRSRVAVHFSTTSYYFSA